MNMYIQGIDGFVGLKPIFIGSYGAVISHYERCEDEIPSIYKLCPVAKRAEWKEEFERLLSGKAIVIRDYIIAGESNDGITFKKVIPKYKSAKCKEGTLIFIGKTPRGNSRVVLKLRKE